MRATAGAAAVVVVADVADAADVVATGVVTADVVVDVVVDVAEGADAVGPTALRTPQQAGWALLAPGATSLPHQQA